MKHRHVFAIGLSAFLIFMSLLLAQSGRSAAALANRSIAAAPSGYVVFDRYPWDTSQESSVRVNRTGRLYKAVYDAAGLTAYDIADYHPALGAMTAQQRGALDFRLPAGKRVIAVAGGTVVKINCVDGLSIRHADGKVAYYLHMSRVDVRVGNQVTAGQVLGLSGSACADAPHLHFALWQGNKEVPVAFSPAPAQTSNGKTCPDDVICPSKANYVEFRYGAGGTTPPTPTPPAPTPTPTTPTGPANYTFCAWENQRCNFSGAQDVAYGANGSFAYRYNVSGGIDCNNAVFGDPAYGILKACFTRAVPTTFVGNVSSYLNVIQSQVRLDVCADNLPGHVVYATLYRGPAAGTGERLWRYTITTPTNERCITFVDMDGAGDTLAGVTYYTVASFNSISDGDAKARRTGCFSATGGRQLCDARSR